MRTKGSTATVKVTLRTLLENHPMGENAVIEVRRKWLEQAANVFNVNFDIEGGAPVTTVKASVPAPSTIKDTIDPKGEKGPKSEENVLTEENL